MRLLSFVVRGARSLAGHVVSLSSLLPTHDLRASPTRKQAYHSNGRLVDQRWAVDMTNQCRATNDTTRPTKRFIKSIQFQISFP